MSVPTARIGELAEQIRGVSYAKDEASDTAKPGYLPVLRAGNITDFGLVFNDLVFVPAERISDRQRVRRHDIVIAASSGSLEVVGKAASALVDFDGSFGAFCKVLRPNSRVHPQYLAHYLRTPEYRRTVSALAAGININNLRNEHLEGLRLRLPPLPEQRRIAAILEKADELRAKRRAALEQLTRTKRSVFAHMFGGDDISVLPTVSLESVCQRVTDGTHQPPKWAASGIPFLFVSNIVDGEVTFHTDKFIGEDTYAELTKRCPIEVGDVLFTTVGSYGNAAVVQTTRKFAFQRHIAHIKPNASKLRPVFLAAALESPAVRRQVDRAARGVAQKTVNLADLKQLTIPLPPLAAQDRFTERCRAIERLHTNQRASVSELDALFASLQHRAFTGAL